MTRVDLPDLIASRGDVRVRSELVGETLRHVVIVPGGHSAVAMHAQIANARAVLRDVPEQLRHIEIKIDGHSAAQLIAAEAKRKRRAARRRGDG